LIDFWFSISKPERRKEEGKRFMRLVQNYVQDDSNHMSLEEQGVITILWSRMSDEELLEIDRKAITMFSKMPQSARQTVFIFLFRAHNLEGRLRIAKLLKGIYENDAAGWEEAAKIIKTEVPQKELAKMSAEIEL